MCTTFLFLGIGIGLFGGYKFLEKQSSNSGNEVSIHVDGKVKRGSNVNIELESNQEQKKRKK